MTLAAALFGLYIVVAYASITWSHAKGLAWDGANLTLLYLILYVIGAALPWRRVTAAAVLVVYGLFAVGVGVVELTRAAAAHDPTTSFQLGRFAAPFGYQNAACAWYLIAAWPLLLVRSPRRPGGRASGRHERTLRVTGVGAAVSEPGSLVAAPITGAAISRSCPVGRGRCCSPSGRSPHGGHPQRNPRRLSRNQEAAPGSFTPSLTPGTPSCSPPRGCGLQVPQSPFVDARIDAPKARRAGRFVVLGGCAVAVVGARRGAGSHVSSSGTAGPARVAGFQGRRNRRPRRRTSPMGSGGTGTTSGGSPSTSSRPSRSSGSASTTSRPTTSASGAARRSPCIRTASSCACCHKPGSSAALSSSAFLGALVASLRRYYRLPLSKQAVAGTALTMAAYWFVHGSVDWFWEIPALGGVAFLCLGIATSLATPHAAAVRASRSVRNALGAVIAAVALAVVVGYALPWLAAEETVRAATTWRRGPSWRVRTAANRVALNPLSDEPQVVEGAIASRLKDLPRMRSAFTKRAEARPARLVRAPRVGRRRIGPGPPSRRVDRARGRPAARPARAGDR